MWAQSWAHNVICIDIDSTSDTPTLAGCKVLTAEDVSRALEMREEDPHCEMLPNTRKGGCIEKTLPMCISCSMCTI